MRQKSEEANRRQWKPSLPHLYCIRHKEQCRLNKSFHHTEGEVALRGKK